MWVTDHIMPAQVVAARSSSRATAQLVLALACLAIGEAFIFIRWRPWTDYYFILVWGGYILLVDYLVHRRSSRSLLRDHPLWFLAMFPVSSLFWWLFEFYNQFVQNWRYLGEDEYQGLKYVLVASLFFSTVLPAVWETVELLLTFFKDGSGAALSVGRASAPASASHLNPPSEAFFNWLPLLGGVLSLLPFLAPKQTFPLVWVGLFLLLDPLNARAGRPSLLVMLMNGQWRVPAAFYVAATITGFFWEFWNYWAWPKWVYTLPPVVAGFPYVFEMPLPGFLGYGPFGWELFALWQFVQFWILDRVRRGSNPKSKMDPGRSIWKN